MSYLQLTNVYFIKVLQTTPKDEQKVVLKNLKQEQRRKMALLGEQYEQTIAEMLQKQSVSHWRMFLYSSFFEILE